MHPSFYPSPQFTLFTTQIKIHQKIHLVQLFSVFTSIALSPSGVEEPRGKTKLMENLFSVLKLKSLFHLAAFLPFQTSSATRSVRARREFSESSK